MGRQRTGPSRQEEEAGHPRDFWGADVEQDTTTDGSDPSPLLLLAFAPRVAWPRVGARLFMPAPTPNIDGETVRRRLLGCCSLPSCPLLAAHTRGTVRETSTQAISELADDGVLSPNEEASTRHLAPNPPPDDERGPCSPNCAFAHVTVESIERG